MTDEQIKYLMNLATDAAFRSVALGYQKEHGYEEGAKRAVEREMEGCVRSFPGSEIVDAIWLQKGRAKALYDEWQEKFKTEAS